MSDFKTRVVVLISGNGSNLQALIDTVEKEQLPIKICAVVSNKDNVFGLKRAEEHNIPAFVIDHKVFPSRASFDARLQEIIDAQGPDLILLAGFMRVLTPEFTEHFLGRMLNIHPSLLPKYQGLNTHKRALEAGDKKHGVSIHFVTAELDGGPIVLQAETTIEADDTTNSLMEKLRVLEHKTYPLVMQWFADGRLEMRDSTCYLDGEKIPDAGLSYADVLENSDHKI